MCLFDDEDIVPQNLMTDFFLSLVEITPEGADPVVFWGKGVIRTLILGGLAVVLGFFSIILNDLTPKLVLGALALITLAYLVYTTVQSVKNYRRTYL